MGWSDRKRRRMAANRIPVLFFSTGAAFVLAQRNLRYDLNCKRSSPTCIQAGATAMSQSMSVGHSPASGRRPLPPGPKGHFFWGVLPELRQDMLGLYHDTAPKY